MVAFCALNFHWLLTRLQESARIRGMLGGSPTSPTPFDKIGIERGFSNYSTDHGQVNMPVKDWSRYPPDWKQISHRIRFERAGGKCEGSPAFPDCRAEHGKPHPETGSKVVLTVAHLDHNPENCEEDNLRSMCQRCHLKYDACFHAQNRKRRNNILNFYSQPRLFEWRDENE